MLHDDKAVFALVTMETVSSSPVLSWQEFWPTFFLELNVFVCVFVCVCVCVYVCVCVSNDQVM